MTTPNYQDENKQTSLENWLKDENLDKAAGLTPTHPGHTVDTNPRWSGQGKGDTYRPVDDQTGFDTKMAGIFGEKRIRLDVVKSARNTNGTWTHVVNTPKGLVKMTDEEHDEYEDSQSSV
jgi:hypothetical protein